MYIEHVGCRRCLSHALHCPCCYGLRKPVFLPPRHCSEQVTSLSSCDIVSLRCKHTQALNPPISLRAWPPLRTWLWGGGDTGLSVGRIQSSPYLSVWSPLPSPKPLAHAPPSPSYPPGEVRKGFLSSLPPAWGIHRGQEDPTAKLSPGRGHHEVRAGRGGEGENSGRRRSAGT